jgi:pimeloyl-ACP methyl ester carboxylesterase
MHNGWSVSLIFNPGSSSLSFFSSLTLHRFQVYCVELYGFGRSSRVRWGQRWEAESLESSLDLMTSALEHWRETLEIPQFILVSHSLSCYVAIAYLLKYPGHVSHLFLTSPIGLNPTASSFSPLGQEGTSSFYSSSSFYTELSQSPHSSSSSISPSTWSSWCPCEFRSLSELLWDSNWTPMDLLRWLGPLGLSNPPSLSLIAVRTSGLLSVHAVVSRPNHPRVLCGPPVLHRPIPPLHTLLLPSPRLSCLW